MGKTFFRTLTRLSRFFLTRKTKSKQINLKIFRDTSPKFAACWFSRPWGYRSAVVAAMKFATIFSQNEKMFAQRKIFSVDGTRVKIETRIFGGRKPEFWENYKCEKGRQNREKSSSKLGSLGGQGPDTPWRS